MERFGLRRVTTFALVLIAAGAALSIFATGQLIFLPLMAVLVEIAG